MIGSLDQDKTSDFGARSTGPTYLLEDAKEPGAYVCHWNGQLVRVADAPPEMQKPSEEQSQYLTRISEDPFVPISKARSLAANLDLDITF